MAGLQPVSQGPTGADHHLEHVKAGRERLVQHRRDLLRVGLPVSRLAKWKTAIQMVALTLLLLGDASPAWMDAIMLGDVALWVAAGLTLITGYDYLRAGARHISGETSPEGSAPNGDSAQRAPSHAGTGHATPGHAPSGHRPETRAKSAGAGPL